MNKLTKAFFVATLALAAGCVSRMDIEHWTLELCDAATTAEIARLVEEGASRDGRVWNDNVRHEERERRRYKLRDGTTIASESSPIRFGTNTVCVAVASHKGKERTEMKNEIVLFEAKDGKVSLPVQLNEETVWLTRMQMAELFEKDRTVILRHIQNAIEGGESKPAEKEMMVNLVMTFLA